MGETRKRAAADIPEKDSGGWPGECRENGKERRNKVTSGIERGSGGAWLPGFHLLPTRLP